jgi:hypothetical protein
MIDICEEISEILSDKMYEIFEKGAVYRELVKIPKDLRGIGKTTALIKLAKKYNLWLVVPNYHMEEYIKKYYEYDNVISQYRIINLRGKKSVKIVFDEGVDLEILRQLDFDIVTGIIYS